jgi:DNA-binding transcriptional ArsR family regulator
MTNLSIDLIKQKVYNTNIMDMFTAIAEPTRRNILEMLALQGELSATDIYKNFHVSHPAISQHLKVLREAHLVQVEKRAQQRMYKINPEPMHELEGWLKKFTTQVEEKYTRLDKVLENEKLKLAKQR